MINKPYYESEHCTLYHGDCLEVMSQIKNDSVDAILSDLPYGVTACSWDSLIPFKPLWQNWWRIGKSDAVIALTASQPFATTVINSQIQHFKYDWIWVKNRPSGMASAKYMPMRNHEAILIFYKEKGKYYPVMEKRDLDKKYKSLHTKGPKRKLYGSNVYGMTAGKTKSYDKLRYPTTVKKFDSVSNHKGNRVHSSQKPLELLEYLIKTYTKIGDNVMDNCFGSGTTGIACVKLGRKFIGIEKEEKYCKIAKKRIQQTEQLMSKSLFSS